jgi:arginine-tRNA-protein transferase
MQAIQTFAELLVARSQEPCPYLAGRTACLPLRLPTRKLTPQEFDERMAQGDRRAGVLLYRPECPRCSACEAIRLDVARFRPTRTQRRVKRRGDAELTYEILEPHVDSARVRLFNRHREGRGLARADGLDGRISASD